MADITTLIVIGVFVVGLIGLIAVLGGIVFLMYTDYNKNIRKQEKQIEQQTTNPNTVPQHTRNKAFSDFIEHLIKTGVIMDTDREYRHLRKKLLDKVDEELENYKRKKEEEKQPNIERELNTRRRDNGRRIN